MPPSPKTIKVLSLLALSAFIQIVNNSSILSIKAVAGVSSSLAEKYNIPVNILLERPRVSVLKDFLKRINDKLPKGAKLPRNLKKISFRINYANFLGLKMAVTAGRWACRIPPLFTKMLSLRGLIMDFKMRSSANIEQHRRNLSRTVSATIAKIRCGGLLGKLWRQILHNLPKQSIPPKQ